MAARTPAIEDGRTLRAERTRRAVVDALLGLLDEGSLRPTVGQVAGRAGVSERSVFQHFHDREALFEAAAARQYERIAPHVERIPAELPLGERVERFAVQRAWLFETVKGVRRAAVLMEPDSPVIAERLRATRKLKAAEVERLFGAEIAARPEDERAAFRAALVAASAWTAWESLRFQQGLGAGAARAAMQRTLSALLGAER
jgi:TetR/AcrR family transcriptional regulator of autoinduction and epiphytic fitness